MKKIVLVFIAFILVAGCSGKKEDTTSNANDGKLTTTSDKKEDTTSNANDDKLTTTSDKKEDTTSNANDGKLITSCSLSSNTNGIELSSSYKITSKDNQVLLIEATEKMKSDVITQLQSVKEQAESIYSKYDDIKGYEYDVKLNGKELTSTINFDYEHMDMDKFIAVNPSVSSIIKDNKVVLDKIIPVYKQMGATCK